jgi:hypothetical protein
MRLWELLQDLDRNQQAARGDLGHRLIQPVTQNSTLDSTQSLLGRAVERFNPSL